MSLVKRGTIYWYDFWYLGKRYQGTTRQTRKDEAGRVEGALKERLRQRSAGLVEPEPPPAPRFQEWADVHLADLTRRRKRTDHVEPLLRAVLRFWGARPADPTKAAPNAPYHDLTLADPITRPAWLLDFEEWMTATGKSPQTRNHYRTAMRGLYKTALKPAFRATAGISKNPMLDLERESPMGRTVTVTVAQLLAWMAHASYHVRLAMAIAALAPKFRISNILRLRFDTSIIGDWEWLEEPQHKTVSKTRRPLVVPISSQLRQILEDAKHRAKGPHVITYQGKSIAQIQNGVQNAAVAAGLLYGRDRAGGVTFHTIRHSMTTLLGEAGVAPQLIQGTLGHEHLSTTMHYMHLRPVVERSVVEQLAEKVPVAAAVMRPGLRIVRKKKAG